MDEVLFSAICSAFELNEQEREQLRQLAELALGDQADSVDADIKFDNLAAEISEVDEKSPVFDAFQILSAELTARTEEA